MLIAKQFFNAKHDHQSSCIIKSWTSWTVTAEAGEQQKQAPHLLPVLKRRTRALPSIMLEEGVRPGITYTGTEPGEEEQGPVEGSPVWLHGAHALYASGSVYASVNTG